MKIVVLTHTFPRDNQDPTAAFMKEFCDGLALNNNEVFIITPFDSRFNRHGDPFKIITYKYIWPDRLHMLGYSKTMEADVQLRKRAYFLIPFMVLFSVITLFRTVKKQKIEIINAHWLLPNGFIAMIVSILTGVPYIITVPGTDAYLATKYKLIGWVAKLTAERASAIFSNSRVNLNKILSLGVNPKIKAIISYPVDISKFKPTKTKLEFIRRRHNLRKGDLVVLAVGRLVYKKGYDYLIRAIKPLTNYNIKLLIAGEGDLKNTWEKLSRSLRINNKVLFIGNVKRDEIVDYYNLSDIMVAPSIIDKEGNVDGGPVANFESMACGKPQVVTDVLGIADVIKDGVNGYVVPQRSVKSLTFALESLIKSKTLRESMGRANRELIRKEISTKSIGRKYTNFFHQVLSI